MIWRYDASKRKIMEEFHRVDRYLSGQMSEEEAELFERELASNESLKEELDWQKEELQAMKEYYEEIELRKKIVDLSSTKLASRTLAKEETEVGPGLSRSNKSVRRFLAIAAGIILILGIFVGRMMIAHGNIALVEAAIVDPLYVSRLKGGNAVGQPTFEDKFIIATLDRDKSLAEDAVEYFSQDKWLDSPVYSQAQIYLGHAHLLNEDFKAAGEVFERMKSDSQFADDANYYLAISQIGLGKDEEAQRILRNVDLRTGYYEDAQKMLRKLKSLWRKIIREII